ncbi:MAG TPA: ACT domain-containing protein [Rudaea sp.]|nr:ACT domain-containing protein [Rudaea sp.]
MSGPISDLRELLRSMRPLLHDGTYVFASLPHDADIGALEPLATFREHEGLSVVVEEGRAKLAQLEILFRAAWITLTVHSDLQAVGLTAAVAAALTEANISCNVIAAARHDHVFVPLESARAAIEVLEDLQRRHR